MKDAARRSAAGLALMLMLVCGASAQGPPEKDSVRITPVVQAYRRVTPAVVNISAERVYRMQWNLFGMENAFEDFLPRRRRRTISLGSGFLVHPDGYIVTNAHVVRRATKITVALVDKSTFAAEVIAANDTHDLAVLRIKDRKGRKFKFLRGGHSDDLMVGETVIAIGNPFGLQNTCTTGVVSALERKLEFRGATYAGLIQIDAPINPGNSGGPLLNIAGELIGINTAIRADAQGIGFAIPVDLLTVDMPKLLDFQRLNRVVLGLSVRQQRGEGGDEVVVASVAADTPAAEAGCEVGDRLIALNDRPVVQLPDYLVPMLSARAGSTVKLQLLRQGKKIDAAPTLKPRPKPDGAALARRLFDMTVREITPALARRMRLRVDRGVVVTGIDPDGVADRLRLAVGDVIYQLGRWYVRELDNVGAILEDVQPGDVLRIGIIRGNARASGLIRVPKIDLKPPARDKVRI